MLQGLWNENAPPSIFGTLKAKTMPAGVTKLANVRSPPTSTLQAIGFLVNSTGQFLEDVSSRIRSCRLPESAPLTKLARQKAPICSDQAILVWPVDVLILRIPCPHHCCVTHHSAGLLRKLLLPLPFIKVHVCVPWNCPGYVGPVSDRSVRGWRRGWRSL